MSDDIRPWAFAVHGGVDPRENVSYSRDDRFRRRKALTDAVHAGMQIISGGGSSLDAVQSAVRVLEDAPCFNAGCGATLAHDGYAELDAAIMDGQGRRAGAVAGLRRVKNPIDLARAVMEHSAHVFIVGDGAELLAVRQGIELVEPSYFITESQVLALRKVQATEPGRNAIVPSSGTVGAVGLDRMGNLAAATSTGGMTGKQHGRVGDSPVIGAGTYAENQACAISATGWGEFLIRGVVAHDVLARIKYGHATIETAAQDVVDDVASMGGYGGLIAVDANGCVALPHSTPRMAYGYFASGEHSIQVSD